MMSRIVTLEWLKELIREGDVSPFYNTKQWKMLRKQKKKIEHNECERCRAKGRHREGTEVHHKKYLRQHPELALDINNLELLCEDCHYDEHHRRNQINEERW